MKLSNLSQNSNMNSCEKYWKELKAEDYSKTFPQVEQWVNNLNSENSSYNSNKIQRMKNFFAFNKFKLAYSFILLAVVFAACNMPVTQNETIGHALSWKVSKSSTEAVEKINSLSWIDKSKLSIKETNEDGRDFLNYSLVLDSKSKDEADGYMNGLKDIAGINSVQIFPLNQTTKVPLYAAALHSFFRVDIDATNKSDAQVKEELQRQLKEAGVTDIKIDFQRDENGNRLLKMEPVESGLKDKNGNHNRDFEMNVTDGNNQQFLKTQNKSDGTLNLDGKSDDEIRKTIIEDLKKNGVDVKPEDLKIERSADGKVQVKFENKQDDKNMKKDRKIELKLGK
ncbi:MAG: hypothetical protein JSS63_01670 [Bacteroidetes bacterium]|nr:hypothetical protein [Bacteroidota bacterium]